ncbi:MAG: M3 family metallopeptidase [Microbacterium sp.]|nr:M3 family metallopeptidase [Microbacterium sp.]
MTTVEPFAPVSTLPYRLPDFTVIGDDDYAPAFASALEQHRAEVAAIADDPADPTFDNTIVALERSGQALARVAHVFWNKVSADATDAILALEEEFAPAYAAHEDSIRMNSALFARIQAVFDRLDDLDLDAESRWLVERYRTEFVRAGAALSDADKARLTEINQRISTLTTQFGKRILADQNQLAPVFDTAAELAGLGESELQAAADAATARGHQDKFLLPLVSFTGHPYLERLSNRETRRRIMTASQSRGRHGGPNDTRELVLEVVRLRAERARLLGYDNHAAYVLDDETAGSPESVSQLLERLVPPAVANAGAEAAALQQLADEQGAGFAIESHDWAFFSEQVRKRDYDLDTESLRSYFEAERVLRDGVFHVARELYGLSFRERDDLTGYHPGVRVFEVSQDGQTPIGLYLLDLYARETKRGGAWMNSLADQSRLLGELPIVVNNLNVVQPPAGEPTLLTLDEATTLFHEFGHGMHGMLSQVAYPKFSGTNVPRDFVELPSQLNETWLLHPAVLPRFAFHVETGEPLPAETVARLRESSTFNQGFRTTEYLAAALLDQAWHRLSPEAANAITDVDAFEAHALADAGVLMPQVPPRYRSAYFLHIFSHGYSAAYYSYIWSEVLDADAERWFDEHGGLSREAGDHYRATVLSVGGSRDPKLTYQSFRGSDAAIEPLLERRGLTAG